MLQHPLFSALSCNAKGLKTPLYFTSWIRHLNVVNLSGGYKPMIYIFRVCVLFFLKLSILQFKFRSQNYHIALVWYTRARACLTLAREVNGVSQSQKYIWSWRKGESRILCPSIRISQLPILRVTYVTIAICLICHHVFDLVWREKKCALLFVIFCWFFFFCLQKTEKSKNNLKDLGLLDKSLVTICTKPF